eukprot:COSAG05_NODE_1872_length_3917_cov_8.508381_4_plen_113_part_00
MCLCHHQCNEGAFRRLFPCAPIQAADYTRADLMGRRVCRWWSESRRWFCGHITDYREPGGGPVAEDGGGASGAVQILYEDLETQWAPLPSQISMALVRTHIHPVCISSLRCS